MGRGVSRKKGEKRGVNVISPLTEKSKKKARPEGRAANKGGVCFWKRKKTTSKKKKGRRQCCLESPKEDFAHEGVLLATGGGKDRPFLHPGTNRPEKKTGGGGIRRRGGWTK